MQLNCSVHKHDDVNILTVPARAAQPVAPAASPGKSGTPTPPPSTLVMMDVCKHAAAQLEVSWVTAALETAKSPQARSSSLSQSFWSC